MAERVARFCAAKLVRAPRCFAWPLCYTKTLDPLCTKYETYQGYFLPIVGRNGEWYKSFDIYRYSTTCRNDALEFILPAAFSVYLYVLKKHLHLFSRLLSLKSIVFFLFVMLLLCYVVVQTLAFSLVRLAIACVLTSYSSCVFLYTAYLTWNKLQSISNSLPCY